MNLQMKTETIANRIKHIIAQETRDIPLEMLHTLHIGVELGANTTEAEGLSELSVCVTEHHDTSGLAIRKHKHKKRFDLEDEINNNVEPKDKYKEIFISFMQERSVWHLWCEEIEKHNKVTEVLDALESSTFLWRNLLEDNTALFSYTNNINNQFWDNLSLDWQRYLSKASNKDCS